MKYILLLLLFVQQPLVDTQRVKMPEHKAWDMLLQEFVALNGDVNYKGFKSREGELKEYLNYLAGFTPDSNWTHNQKLAYYINLYNAGTIALILENYPLKSIKDIKNPWGKKLLSIGGNAISLGDLEHKILRKMNEPRIHFAINCASFSCPKLRNKAYTPIEMERQLEEATRDFINDKSKNKLSADQVELSAIFKWYKGDFTEKRSLITYLEPYTKIALKESARISYLPYDWRLNEK
jgi:hypothetical protein